MGCQVHFFAWLAGGLDRDMPALSPRDPGSCGCMIPLRAQPPAAEKVCGLGDPAYFTVMAAAARA